MGCSAHIMRWSSDLLESDLLAWVPLLVQLRYRQNVLLPVLFPTLDKVRDAGLDVRGDTRLVEPLLHWRELSRRGLVT